MPENEAALSLWLAVQTQWRAGGMGIVGLDYGEVRRWARDMGVVMTAAVWGKIRALERHVLAAVHDDRDDRQRRAQAAPRHSG